MTDFQESLPTKRRQYTPQFKAELVRMSRQPGMSMTLVAKQHGINPNVISRWSKKGLGASSTAANTGLVKNAVTPPFVSVPLPLSQSAAGVITVELLRGPTQAKVQVPVHVGPACLEMLKDWFR